MSKSSGNVITPDEVTRQYGADALRVYELFVAPFEETVQWSDKGIRGSAKFLARVWRLVTHFADGFSTKHWQAQIGDVTSQERDLRRKTHLTILKVTEDIENFRFNTAVAALMEWVNGMYDIANTLPSGERSAVLDEAVEYLIQLLAPFTPHLADELWEAIGKEGFLYRHSWPEADISATQTAEVTLVVQLNGKLRDKFTVPADIDAEEVKKLALARPKVTAALQGCEVKEVVVVPLRLVNIVTQS
jgi:leucyl-tRNA synthetase